MIHNYYAKGNDVYIMLMTRFQCVLSTARFRARYGREPLRSVAQDDLRAQRRNNSPR